MADQPEYEFNPVTRLTVGALGQPGHRVFVLQAGGGGDILHKKLEKQQVVALAQGIDTMWMIWSSVRCRASRRMAEPSPQA
jgi:hypothetical protein